MKTSNVNPAVEHLIKKIVLGLRTDQSVIDEASS